MGYMDEPGSVGNVIYFMEQFCGYFISSKLSVEGVAIFLYSKQFATVDYDTADGYPHFKFLLEPWASMSKREYNLIRDRSIKAREALLQLRRDFKLDPEGRV